MNTSVSLFGQILSLIPKHKFQKIVFDYQADKHKQTFDSYDHLVSMVFCQLAKANSLREICGGLKICGTKLNHLGMGEAPSKSNLSYSNANRDYRIFEEVFYALLRDCQAHAPKHDFSFKKKLYSLDATVIDLCLKSFPWARYRQTKGAIKLHMLLDHDGYLPVFMNFTDGKVHEVTVAKYIDLPRDSIVACDRGYIDWKMLYRWNINGVCFVSRLKSNTLHEEQTVDLKQYSGNVLKDEVILLSGKDSRNDYPEKLRKVLVCDLKNRKTLEIVTNNFELDAQTIGDIYKERWQIESFFRTIKQNLKIKTFVGTSENAVKIQVWTALISLLLVKFLKFLSKAQWHISTLVAFLRWNLFVYRNLQEWLDNPFSKPPIINTEQMEFAF